MRIAKFGTPTRSSLTRRLAPVLGALALSLTALPFIAGTASAAPLNPLSPPAVVSVSPNSAVLGYVATATEGSGATAPTSVTIAASPGTASCVITIATQSDCTLTGLTNGVAYTATQSPSANDTVDTTSAASATFTPLAALAAPVAINDGTAGVKVSFTADGTDTAYIVQAYAATVVGGNVIPGAAVAGGTCTVASSPTPPTGIKSCVVLYTSDAGALTLSPSTMYVFTVAPTNASPVDSISAYSNLVTTSTALNTPTAVTNGSGSSVVSFATDGVATTYTVAATSSDGGAPSTCVLTSGTAFQGAQSCTVNSLTNAKTYTFTVTPAGNSTTSTVSGASDPLVIGALLTPTAVATGPGGATVSFNADGVATTYVVNAYVATPLATNPVTYSYGAATVVCNITVDSPLLTGIQTCTVTGLASSTLYAFTVTPSGGGTTSLESGYSAPISTTTPLTTPTASSGPASGSVTVYFTPDSKALVYTVNAFVVTGSGPYTYTATAFSCADTFTSVPVGAQSCIVTGLTVGIKYAFSVTPSGGGTLSATSYPSTPVTVTAPTPAPTAVVNGPGTALITYSTDGVATTYQITAQQVSALISGTNVGGPIVVCSLTNNVTPPTGVKTCTSAALTNGDYYTFTVVPSGNSDTAGSSSPSAAIQITTALATPTATSSASGTAVVSFTANGVATTYTVNAYLASLGSTTGTPAASCVVAQTTAPLLSGAQSCSVTGLTNATSYVFTVTPSGGANASTVSAASLALDINVTPLGTPAVATGATGSVKVSFTADGVATTYTVKAYLTSIGATGTPVATCVLTQTTAPLLTGAQSCIVTGLTNGTSYVFTVTPSGGATLSGVSAVSAAITPTALTAPTGLAAAATYKSLTVTWSAATDVGGPAVTGYVVTATAGNVTVSCGTVAATATTCLITGLVASTSYVVTATASNGISTASASVTAKTTALPRPTFMAISSRRVRIGHTTSVAIRGTNLAGVSVASGAAGVAVRNVTTSSTRVTFKLVVSRNDRPGTHHLIVRKAGEPALSITYYLVR